jgi:two-component system sensor kinase FixL
MQLLWAGIDSTVPPTRSEQASYFVVVIAALMAAVATLVVQRLTSIHLPFLIGETIVIFAAWLAGPRSTIIAGAILVVTTALIDDYASAPHHPIDYAAVAVFVAIMAIASRSIRRLRDREQHGSWRCTQRELYLQALFDGLPAPMMVVDSADRICAINLAACALFGITKDVAVGSSVGTFVTSLNSNGSASRSSLSETCGRTRHEGQHSSGARLDLSLATTSIAIGDATFRTFYVHDETAELRDRRRLIETETKLAQLGRAVALGAMGSAIAHELNQPLAAAASYAGTAQKLLAEPSSRLAVVRSAVDGAIDQIIHAGRVLRGLRSFVEATPPTLEWHDVTTLFTDSVRIAHFAVAAHSALLSIDVPSDVGEVLIDRIQLQQVLVNLINNAAEAMADSALRTMVLSARRLDAERLLVSVADTGPGIDPEIAGGLFKIFNTSKSTGLGVGLSISRTIIEAHGESLWCEGRPGGGTVFNLTLRHRGVPVGSGAVA